MPVLQRFYPEFFFNATFIPILGASEEVVCNVALFNEDAAFDEDSGPVLGTSFLNTSRIENSILEVTLQVTRDGTKLMFAVPEISWSELPNVAFKHVIIWMIREVNSGSGSKSFYSFPFMHFDLGTSLLPVLGEFVFSPSEVCIPNIDFDYEVCV